MCAKAIVQAGITKVVYDKEGQMDPNQKKKFYEYESSRTIIRHCLEKKKSVNIISLIIRLIVIILSVILYTLLWTLSHLLSLSSYVVFVYFVLCCFVL